MNFDSTIFYSHDINKAIDFYNNLIGLGIEYRQGDIYVSFIFPNQVRLGVKKAESDREIPGSQTIIISTEEIDKLYDRLREKRVEIYSDIENESWGRTFSILDVDGNRIEFLNRN
jgi:predicted enzyme related to lactoylglutathione lyase